MKDLKKIKQNIKIEEYARFLGYHTEKIGRYYTLKEHDSVRIDPEKNIFIRNSIGVGGSIIDFLMHFESIDFKSAVRKLSKEVPIDKSYKKESIKKIEKKDEEEVILTLPKRDKTMKNIYAYLVNTRGIEQKIINDMVHRKVLYQDIHKNCVFVSRNNKGELKFICLRGTNTYRKFIGDVEGCDYSYGLFLNNTADKLLITECAIDGMSIMSLLYLNEKDYLDYDYLSLSGCGKAEAAVMNQIMNHSYKDIFICLDNDEAGLKTSSEIYENVKLKINNIKIHTIIPKYGKDFNDELIELRKEGKNE